MPVKKKAAPRDWKTTTVGIVTLALAGLAIWQHPASAADPQTLAAITSGVGLLVAGDSQKKPKPAEAAQ